MTPEQISLVQRTFTHMRPIAETAATLFYERLFTLDPSLRPLFRGNMQQQGVMLMRMLTWAIEGLHRPDTLFAPLQALGQRYVGYGVRASHYDTVGEALLWTLEQALGAQWTLETRAAWSAAYTLLATAMQPASARDTRAPACLERDGRSLVHERGRKALRDPIVL
jgi:hemoglobin-like flavoprotein